MRGGGVRVVVGETIRVQIGTHRERGRDIGVHAPEIPHAVRGWSPCVRPRAGQRDPAAPQGRGPSGGASEEIGPIQLAELDGGFGDRLEPASPPHVQ